MLIQRCFSWAHRSYNNVAQLLQAPNNPQAVTTYLPLFYTFQMAKGKQSKTFQNSEKSRTKAAPATALRRKDIASLVSIRDENLKQFGKAKNTRKAYSGYLARGQCWLGQIVEDAREMGLEEFEGMSIDGFKAAFDNPPNRHSATALELFLVQKCFTEGLKEGTADGIHAAFTEYWESMCVHGIY